MSPRIQVRDGRWMGVPPPASLHGEISMAAGTTHEAFAEQSLVHPWHQVVALIDCLWPVKKMRLIPAEKAFAVARKLQGTTGCTVSVC